MPFTFEKLHVYQKAVDFADTICGLTERFPRGYGFVVDQVKRAYQLLYDPPSGNAAGAWHLGLCAVEKLADSGSCRQAVDPPPTQVIRPESAWNRRPSGTHPPPASGALHHVV